MGVPRLGLEQAFAGMCDGCMKRPAWQCLFSWMDRLGKIEALFAPIRDLGFRKVAELIGVWFDDDCLIASLSMG